MVALHALLLFSAAMPIPISSRRNHCPFTKLLAVVSIRDKAGLRVARFSRLKGRPQTRSHK